MTKFKETHGSKKKENTSPPLQNSFHVTEQQDFHPMSDLIATVLRTNGLLAQRDASDTNLIRFVTHFHGSNTNVIFAVALKRLKCQLMSSVMMPQTPIFQILTVHFSF